MIKQDKEARFVAATCALALTVLARPCAAEQASTSTESAAEAPPPAQSEASETVPAEPAEPVATAPVAAAGEPGADADAASEQGPTQPSTQGLSLEGGLGVALAFGAVARDAIPMNEVSPLVPVGHLRFGYRTGHWWFGASALGGVCASSKDGALDVCGEDGVRCRSSVLRADAVLRFFPLPGAVLEPFVGLGTGYEWFSFSAEVEDDTVAVATARGASLLSVEAGAQLWRGERSAWLTSLSYSASSYDHRRLVVLGESPVSEEIAAADRVLHHWVSLNTGAVFTQ